MKKSKDVLYQTALVTNSENDWCLFKQARNKYVNKINYASKMDIMNDLRKKKSDQKGMWRVLKSLISEKGSNNMKCVKFENEEIEVSKESELRIANKFNEFFIDSVNDLHESIENNNAELDMNGVKLCSNEFKFQTKNN